MSTPTRRIAHLDMDAFYASCELMRYPQLRGLPVVIGGRRRREDDWLPILQALQPEGDWDEDHLADRLDQIPLQAFARIDGYVGRGVITTATYEARQFGVGSAMGLMKAAQLCPQAVLLPVDFERYHHFSRRFKQVITEIAPVMEDRGVDEVYIDFTAVPGGQREGGRVLARLIQKSIFQETGLTCSIGVAPNKLLAKMASEFNKPNGISVVYEDQLQSLIWSLPCRKINGIGPKAEERLKSLGIEQIGQLAAQDRFELMAQFGRAYGAWLHDAAWGRDDRAVETESEPVGISRETTFERDLHAVQDKVALGAVFTQLCAQVAADLVRKGYVGRTVGIKLRYDNFQSVTRDVSVDRYTAQAERIRQLAGQCLKRVDLNRRIRLLGVRVGSLMRVTDWQALQAQEPQAGYGESESLF